MAARRPKYAHLNDHPPPLREPSIPLKEVALAGGLFLIGTTFLTIGIHCFFTSSFMESIPLVMLGALTFIPGVYHCFLFFMILRKVPGYTVDMIPKFD
eukprot:CAMPEP_0172727540 /NCGR_PEP_ID=MMETSP1074-20121228/91738_1 /TAXON_ID=2916 /ORGANISM="Ceratium fusus, Strain PA161109" /LENGTH=97 /DNA_ID=CAMNT_0013554703 /DNA_START=30 /DNA_END=323 /DNA_ORIENTATION=-